MGCFDFFQLPGNVGGSGGDDEQSAAHARAREALLEVLSGYSKIAQLALPPGAALVFANLRRNILQLETLIASAQFPKARPWLLPLPEEQQDWENLFPDGGYLLRRQVCMASVDDEDWFLGGLFISDLGIVFDTGDAEDETICFQTGFLPWRDIQSFERPGAKTEVVLSVVRGCYLFGLLRLQLSIANDVEWMEEFWKLRSAMPNKDSIPFEHEKIQIPLATHHPRLLLPTEGVGGASPSRSRSPSKRGGSTTILRSRSLTMASASGFEKMDEVSPARAYRAMSTQSNVSALYADGPGGRQGAQIPTVAPVREESVKGLSVEEVRAKFKSDGFIPSLVVASVKARDFTATPWSESKRTQGMFVRKANFTMPLPKDFPKAVTRLVNLPEDSNVTAVYRLFLSEDKVVITSQTCSHGVPYGENFRIHETTSYEASGPGLKVSKWAEVMWVADLPWTHGMLKGIIESKAKADSAKNLSPAIAALQAAS